MSQFPPKITPEGTSGPLFSQDFRGGLTDAQLANLAHSAIHAIAHLGDHLRRFAKASGFDQKAVDRTIEASHALKILIDLSNNDKHGYPPRAGGRSGVAPRITKYRRPMRITIGPGQTGSTQILLTASGPRPDGPDNVTVIVTGDVVAADGSALDDLQKLLETGAEAWEGLLRTWGVRLNEAI